MKVKTALVSLFWILLCFFIPINAQNYEIIHIDAANASTISRTASQGFKNFDKQTKKYLNVAPIKILQVKAEKVCTLRCVAELQCVSFNFAVSPSSTGHHQCELLATDMFTNSANLTVNPNQHHFAMQTKCFSTPCKNNGVCIPNYSSDTYTCKCVYGYSGDRCEIDPACSSYTNITDGNRNVNFSNILFGCDNEIDKPTVKWYRLTGAAGSRMPTWCVPQNRCYAHSPGWLNDSHPTVEQGIVSKHVCFNDNNNCCDTQFMIRVIDCGEFYLYEFRAVNCYLRYCGTD